MLMAIPLVHTRSSTLNVSFLQKSDGENSKVEKPILNTTSYEGSNDEEELKTVPIVNENNINNNVVSDSDNDSKNENQEYLFNKDINEEVKVAPKTTINTKVVHAIKNLQASYNNSVNKII